MPGRLNCIWNKEDKIGGQKVQNQEVQEEKIFQMKET